MGTEHQADQVYAEVARELAFEAYREQMLIEKYGVTNERNAKNFCRSS